MSLHLKTSAISPLQSPSGHGPRSRRPLVSAESTPHWSDSLIKLIHRTLNELGDPVFFAPMAAAQGAFGLGRWGMSKLFSTTFTKTVALIGANAGAFALEGLAFVGAERGLTNALDRKSFGERNFGKELGHAYLTMGLLRGFGAFTKATVQLHLGRLQPAAFSRQDKFLYHAAPHLASFGGIFASHTLAPYWGLGEYMDPMDRLLQSGVAMFHFAAAGHLLHHIPGYTRFLQQLQKQTLQLANKLETSRTMVPPPLVLVTGDMGIAPGLTPISPLDLSTAKMESFKDEPPLPPTVSSSAPATVTKLFPLETNAEIARTLRTFLQPRPSLKDLHFIPGLRKKRVRKLEDIFDKGGSIWDIGGRPMLIELLSGAQTTSATPGVRRQDILFYYLWKKRFGFRVEKTEEAVKNWGKLQKKAQDLGIEIGHEGPKDQLWSFGAQFRLIHEILEMLPDSLLKNPKLRRIHLLTERKGNALASTFKNQEIYLYYGLFFGSRRNMAGLFLHELGHVTDDRYQPGAQGDSSIPESIREKMRKAHRVIAGHRAFIGLDYAGGPDYRKGYQGDFFGEFIADLNPIYVAAGPLLRQHVASFSKDSEVGKAWNFVYRELRDRIYEGREYDYSPSFETNPDTASPLWHSSHSPDSIKSTMKSSPRQIRYEYGRYRFGLPEQGSELILGRKHFARSHESTNISSTHLKLFRFEDFYFVQDLGSKNGTEIIQADGNKMVLKDPARRPTIPHPILRGDRIRLPGVELSVDF